MMIPVFYTVDGKNGTPEFHVRDGDGADDRALKRLRALSRREGLDLPTEVRAGDIEVRDPYGYYSGSTGRYSLVMCYYGVYK